MNWNLNAWMRGTVYFYHESKGNNGRFQYDFLRKSGVRVDGHVEVTR